MRAAAVAAEKRPLHPSSQNTTSWSLGHELPPSLSSPSLVKQLPRILCLMPGTPATCHRLPMRGKASGLPPRMPHAMPSSQEDCGPSACLGQTLPCLPTRDTTTWEDGQGQAGTGQALLGRKTHLQSCASSRHFPSPYFSFSILFSFPYLFFHILVQVFLALLHGMRL